MYLTSSNYWRLQGEKSVSKILRNSLVCMLLFISCEAGAVCFWVPIINPITRTFSFQQQCFADPPPSDPALAGDVVGRDLNYPLLGWFGHLGLWDGARVVEVVSGTANAIRLTTLSTFKSTSTYWGTASANIPNYYVYGCFSALCQNWWLAPEGQVEMVRTRFAIAKRAYQAYLIGADYTVTAQYVRARPGDGYYPAIRGSYRCDTFVLDMLYASIEGGYYGSYWDNYRANVDPTWEQRWNALSWTIAPRAIFDKLATYQ